MSNRFLFVTFPVFIGIESNDNQINIHSIYLKERKGKGMALSKPTCNWWADDEIVYVPIEELQPSSPSTGRNEIYNGPRKYECYLCRQSAIHLGNLKQHMARHIGERKFQCKRCEKRSALGSQIA